LAWGLVAAQIAVAASAFGYVATRPSEADAAGQRVCRIILAKPFVPVPDDSAVARQLRADEIKLDASGHWMKVASDLRAISQALSSQDLTARTWDKPCPSMIQDCRDAM